MIAMDSPGLLVMIQGIKAVILINQMSVLKGSTAGMTTITTGLKFRVRMILLTVLIVMCALVKRACATATMLPQHIPQAQNLQPNQIQ